MIRRPPRSTLDRSSAASDVYKRQGDIFVEDFSTATVVTLYLLPELNLKLRPTILKMKPGTRVTSHQFHMGDWAVSYTHLRAHETVLDLVCRLLLEKKNTKLELSHTLLRITITIE